MHDGTANSMFDFWRDTIVYKTAILISNALYLAVILVFAF